MRLTSFWVSVFLAATALACAARAAPLEAYGRLPAIEEAAISPDGARLAVIVTDGEARTIRLLDAANLATVLTVPAGVSKVRSIQWAGARHLIVTASRTTAVAGLEHRPESPNEEWLTAIDVNLDTRKPHILLANAENAIDSVLAPPMIRILDGRPFAFVEGYHFASSTAHPSLFRIDLDRNTTQLVQEGAAFDDDWLVDERGEPIARTQFDPHSGTWSLLLCRNGLWRTAKTLDGLTAPTTLLGLGRDGETALLSTRDGDDEDLREFAPDGSDWRAPIASGAAPRPIHDPATGRTIGVRSLDGDTDHVIFFDPQDQARWDGASRAYPGERMQLVSLSADHQKMVVLIDFRDHGPAFALVDIPAGRARLLGALYPGVWNDVAPVQPIAFKASDGMALTGYLTVPKDKAAKDLPLVVLPHGGPADRDRPGFDWWAQAMASRGYAVLQVNYRGSQGFGWNFLSAGFGQYGRRMQTDLSDGVRWLASHGTIDPKRVCIVGASYGGYAALAGVTLDPGVYRCAVSVAGISDMRRMVDGDPYLSKFRQKYWRRYVGVDTGAETFAAISPINHLDRIDAPVLLIHGTDDTVVPYEQSRSMAEALRKAGRPVEFMTLKSEDHWLDRGDTRLQMLEATVDFLEKNDPPG